MAEVSAYPENADQFRKIELKRVVWLESQIESLNLVIPFDNFISGKLYRDFGVGPGSLAGPPF